MQDALTKLWWGIAANLPSGRNSLITIRRRASVSNFGARLGSVGSAAASLPNFRASPDISAHL